jgi:surface carbohydrate biosynthesis protein
MAENLVTRLLTKLLPLPVKAPVAIIYEDRVAMIEKWVLKEIPYVVVKVDGGICLHPIVLLRTLTNLKYLDWNYVFNSKKRFLALAKQVYEIHLLALLQFISPKVVLTTIDNSTVFHRLSLRHRTAQYFAIMNGLRSLIDLKLDLPPPPHLNAKLKMTNFFCFGEHEIDVYKRFDHEVEKFHVAGAFVWGCYQEAYGEKNIEVTYDICYVSQWDTYHSYADHALSSDAQMRWPIFHLALAALETYLASLVEESSLSLLIALRYENCEQEKEYFRDKFGDQVDFVEANRLDFSAYRAMDSARLVITLNSTCGVEAFGAGRKVLFCNMTEHPHFALQVKRAGLGYLGKGSFGEFKLRVMELLEMDPAKYRYECSDGARYLVKDDPQNPVHKRIRQLTLEAITT